MALKATSESVFNTEAVTGKWNNNKIIAFLKEQHKVNTEKTFKLKELYSEFYGANKVIKHWTFYTRKHILDAMIHLEYDGYVRTAGELIKIGFKN